MSRYTITREISGPFDTVVHTLPIELEKEGFTVLSSIRIDDLFQKHLGVEFKKYAIFGVSNLPLMYRSLQYDISSGVFSIVNIILCELASGTVTGTIKVSELSALLQDEHLQEGSMSIERRLNDVLLTIGNSTYNKVK